MENNVSPLCVDGIHNECRGKYGLGVGVTCQCQCHYNKAAEYAHRTLERYEREGRKASDFRMHAIAIHHSALQYRLRRIVDRLQKRAVENADVDNSIFVEPVGKAEIDDTTQLLFGVYERGLEDGKKRGIEIGEERERQRVEGLERLRAAKSAWSKTVAKKKRKTKR